MGVSFGPRASTRAFVRRVGDGRNQSSLRADARVDARGPKITPAPA